MDGGRSNVPVDWMPAIHVGLTASCFSSLGIFLDRESMILPLDSTHPLIGDAFAETQLAEENGSRTHLRPSHGLNRI